MSTIPTLTGITMGKVISHLAAVKKAKEQRDGKPITWEQVAKETGLAYSTVLRWANDNVNRFDEDALAKLCEYFAVDVGDILKYEE